jgi:hypothetical protein
MAKTPTLIGITKGQLKFIVTSFMVQRRWNLKRKRPTNTGTTAKASLRADRRSGLLRLQRMDSQPLTINRTHITRIATTKQKTKNMIKSWDSA